MKKISFLILVILTNSILIAQNLPSIPKGMTTNNGMKINARKSTMVEKQMINIGKFKSLNFQKISLKDLADNSIENTLGIMLQWETYDYISKKTLIIEKPELVKLISSLQVLEQKENTKIDNPTKYKFLTINNIEFGAIYNNELKKWSNYINFPSDLNSKNIITFDKEDLKELLTLLIKAEREL